MAGNNSGPAGVLNFFNKTYKGAELAPTTAFHGLGAQCEECGYKD